MSFSELLGSASYEDGILRSDVPAGWAQGRTAYGGLASSFLYERVKRQHPDLPPMRSVQIAFIGPASGAVEVTAEVLRQGKSTTFVEASLKAEAGLATRGTFIFGAGRDSSVAMADNPAPEVPHVSTLDTSAFTELHPAFLHQFEVAPASGGMPFMGDGSSEMVWWGRHRDPEVHGTEVGLLCIGDLLPPAVAPMMKTFAPVSSVNWQVDTFGDDLSTEDGWYLIQTRAQWGGDGWSSQDMNIWASDGRPVAGARQTVVVFS